MGSGQVQRSELEVVAVGACLLLLVGEWVMCISVLLFSWCSQQAATSSGRVHEFRQGQGHRMCATQCWNTCARVLLCHDLTLHVPRVCKSVSHLPLVERCECKSASASFSLQHVGMLLLARDSCHNLTAERDTHMYMLLKINHTSHSSARCMLVV